MRKAIPDKDSDAAEDILNKILGGGAETQTAPAPTQQQQTVDPLEEPEKALKRILKGIIK